MSFRHSLAVAAVLSISATTVFASSGSTFVGGEVNFRPHALAEGKTSAQVRNELNAFIEKTKAENGGTTKNGEIAYVPAQHAFAIQGGTLVHTDDIPHTRKAMPMAQSLVQRQQAADLYVN